MKLDKYLKNIIWLVITIVSISYFYMKALTIDSHVQILSYEIELLAFIVLVILSFPLGFISLWLIVLLMRIFYPEHADFDASLNILLIGSSCLIGGYLQWFYMLPKAIKKYSKNQRRHP